MVTQQEFDQRVEELYQKKISTLLEEDWDGDYKDCAELHAKCVHETIDHFELDEHLHFAVGDAINCPRSYWSYVFDINHYQS